MNDQKSLNSSFFYLSLLPLGLNVLLSDDQENNVAVDYTKVTEPVYCVIQSDDTNSLKIDTFQGALTSELFLKTPNRSYLCLSKVIICSEHCVWDISCRPMKSVCFQTISPELIKPCTPTQCTTHNNVIIGHVLYV